MRAFLLVEGAAGLGVCATRGQPDMRGLGTAGPGFVFRARRLAAGVTDLRFGPAAHRCVTDALARRAQGARRLLDQRVLADWSVGGRDRPAEAGELARGGDRDDGPALVALLDPVPDVVQAPLRLP